MTYTCDDCGKIHDKLPQFFMWRSPVAADGSIIAITEDRKSMGRTEDGQFFIRCEIELPVIRHAGTVLGLICWVEVAPEVYEQILRLRQNEDGQAAFTHLIEGWLANPVQGVRNSYGTRVGFEVVADDPTPYIRWASARSSLGRRMKTGATSRFWHRIASGKI